MLRARHRKSLLLVSFGLLLGLVVGLGLHAGLSYQAAEFNKPILPLEELKLRATASHGSETFMMATGPVDEAVEAVFMLDFLTGDLTCFALNNRTGKFNAFFKRNVITDLPVEKGKKPAYVMCTGAWNPLRGGAGGIHPAGCVAYVADCNTGYFAAYTIPWQTGLSNNAGATGAAPMVLLDGGKARDLQLRDK